MKKSINILRVMILLCLGSTQSMAHEIGEYFQGGIIFWIDKNDVFERVLIAASSDQAKNIKWANREYATGAVQDGVLAGKENTTKIINALGPAGNYAARIASSYKVGSYNDWYLPSKYELDLMYKQRFVIGEFSTNDNSDGSGCNHYWSSTEVETAKAWSQSFNSGTTDREKACGVDGSLGHVRAIRSYQEVFTTFSCWVTGNMGKGDSSCVKWHGYVPDVYIQGCGATSLASQGQPIFQCAAQNGSVLVSSKGDFVDPKTNKLYQDVLLTNEVKFFYGAPTAMPSTISIGAKFVTPK